MATLDHSDKERRKKKKREAKKSVFAPRLLKAVFIALPLLTKVAQLGLAIKDLIR